MNPSTRHILLTKILLTKILLTKILLTKILLTKIRGLLLVMVTVTAMGCSRNYGPQGDGNVDGTGPNATTNAVFDDGEKRIPFMGELGVANALHLPPGLDAAVVDLGNNRYAVFAGAFSLVWDSQANRVVKRLNGTSLSRSTRLVWKPDDGTSALVANGAAYYWINAVDGTTRFFDNFASTGADIYTFDDAFIMKVTSERRTSLAEFFSANGRPETRFQTDLEPAWRNSLQSVGDVYFFRDENGDVAVRPIGSDDESVKVEGAFRNLSFDDERYLYFEGDRPRLFDTADGAEVEFPQEWRLYVIDAPDREWVYIQSGVRLAFWKPGSEPVEVEPPATDTFERFAYAFADPDFGVVYANTSDGDRLMLYGYDSQQWYEISGVAEAPRRTRPTTARSADGEPVVMWAGRYGDSLEGAHFWTPRDGVQPLSGYRDTLSQWERTTDPNRFVALNQSNRLVLADIQRRTMLELGLPVNCENRGISHDGRRAMTYVEQTVSLFDADDLSSRVIARNPVFFGEQCEESFNRALSRGLFLNAFDGNVGDLVYWDGSSVTNVATGIPEAGAILDPVRGIWTIAAPANKSVYLAVFEAERELLTEIGRASASNLADAYDYDGLEFVYMDTMETSPPRATIFQKNVGDDGDPLAVASGAFVRVQLLGDDILAWNADEELPSLVILSTDLIDPGPLEEWLWDGEEDELPNPRL